MIRQAAISLIRRGNISCRQSLPKCTQTLIQNSTPKTSGRGQHSRLLTTTTTSSTTPKVPKDKGQEALEKSQRLHAELKEMIEAQKQKQLEELNKPYGSNFIAFIKSSKPELVNIFFAFVCVLLAYQIHGMRAKIRKLLAEKDVKNDEIDTLRGILATLSSEGSVNNEQDEAVDDNSTNTNTTFSATLAEKCANIIGNIFTQSEQRVGYSWILGKKLAIGDRLEVDNLIDQLQPVILSEIQGVVGDAAYTKEELKERRVKALNVDQEDSDSTSMLGNGTSTSNAQMGDLMQVLEEVHNQDLTDGQSDKKDNEEDGNSSTKVRRTRYAI